jgi:PAS domain S-box-containing protein
MVAASVRTARAIGVDPLRRAIWGALGTAGLAALAAPARSRESLRYGGDVSFAPFESLDVQGRPVGFQIELLNELGRVLDMDVQIALLPWAQTEAAFRAGALDAIAMVDTAERRAWADFANSHATPAFAVYHRRGRPDPQVLTEAAGKRVAVLAGEAMEGTLHAWLATLPATYLRVPEPTLALAAVQRGDADWALLPRAYGDRALAAMRTSDVVAGTQSFRLQAYALAVARDNVALLEKLQRGLDELERNGRLEELRLRWLGSHRELAAQRQLQRGLTIERRWTWGVGAGGALVATMLGALVWRRGRRVQAESRRRREAEGALQRAEELLARSFTRNPEPMLIVERGSGVVRDANDALCALLGVQAEQFVGQPLRSQDRHVEAQALTGLVASLDQDGALAAAPLRITRADGARRDCLVSADTLHVGDAVQVFCVLRDITEQLERDHAMRAGYDELRAQLVAAQSAALAARAGRKRAEGALQDFTRAVAHDLRSPLHAVQGFVGLLRMRLQEGHVQEALVYSEHIERAALRMTSMIAALSGLAQVSRAPLQRQTVDMTGLARDAWGLLAAAQPQRRVECRIGVLPPAQAEADLVAQIWQNLLDNAWKYSAQVADARVAVDSFRDERGTWYRVTDNGAGFDMAGARKLFVPFQRMHSESQFAGTGVGLSLVKRIVDHHGGDIRVRSTPGVGTIVEFTLDAAP